MMRGLLPAGVLAACALAYAPIGAAEPVVPSDAPAPPAAEAPAPPFQTDSASGPSVPPPDAGSPVATACSLFDAAISVAAVNYEDFAYATAGRGNYVNYQDPNVVSTNVVGRTALRQAAAAALSASRTDGLPPEVAGPMRTWSLRATKLVVVMGLHGGGDTLNDSVNGLNGDAQEAQMACAQAQLG